VVAPDEATGAPDEIVDIDGKLAAVHRANDGDVLLFRPDQHLVTQQRGIDAAALRTHVLRCMGHPENAR
jgi:hypothetical protein